jgi:hypothetical protein
MRISAVACICVGFLIASCGLFYPQDIVEPPQLIVTVDPFNFRGILANTGQQFTRPNYTDFFAAKFEYVDYLNQTFLRDPLINRFQHIDTSKIDTVIWSLISGSTEPQMNQSDTNPVVLDRQYQYITHSGNSVLDTMIGKSEFTLQYLPAQSAWAIIRWKDQSADGGMGMFDPENSNP